MKAFDFGANWREFSETALDPPRVDQARAEFRALVGKCGTPIAGRSFLDIGFGQGLSLLAAASDGARALGCDINPTCAKVLAANSKLFPDIDANIPVVVGSILDRNVVDELRARSLDGAGYDIVHSWGVLHHTGDMWKAIAHAAELVAPGGIFVLAIYNQHWTSPLWVPIKRGYCAAPRWLQRAMIGIFYPVILAAKALVTWRNPFTMERGMDFYYNVVDWVGGYPYEYASLQELARRMEKAGFSLRWQRAANVPTGCNEQIFVRTIASGARRG